MRKLLKFFIFMVSFLYFPLSLYSSGMGFGPGLISGYVFNDSDRNQTKDIGESGTMQHTFVKLCFGNWVIDSYEILPSNTDGSYSFTVMPHGRYTIIEDSSNNQGVGGCFTSLDPVGWSSSTSNYIQVDLNITNRTVTDINFGNFKDDTLPLSAVDKKSAYLIQNKPSDVFRLNLVTGDLDKLEDDITPSDFHVNGLGYNVKDGYLWGSAPRRGSGTGDGYITRVGKDSSGRWVATHYGPIPNLSIFSYTGDIDKDGRLHIFRHNDTFISIIDLDPNSPTYLTAIDHIPIVDDMNNTVYIKSTDWAFNPKDNMLYTVNNGDGAHFLYRINPKTGVMTNLGDTQISNSLSGGVYHGITGELPPGHPVITPYQRIFGGSFFTADGFYYLYDNGHKRPTGEVFRIDISNPFATVDPKAIPFSKPRATTINDGVMFAENSILLDMGDAPDDSNSSSGDGTAVGNYRTLLSDDGPRHQVPTSGATIYLGLIPPDINSSESDGQPNILANGDGVEEDGVKIAGGATLQSTTIKVGDRVDLEVITTGNGFLNAWIDFNGDGAFTSAEQIAANVDGASGVINIPNIVFPSSITTTMTYARFRYSSDRDLAPTGAASDGEIEDYLINLDIEKSLFSAWDIDESISNPVIKTKIVNEDINLTIASVDFNGSQFRTNLYPIVQAAIFSNSNQLTSWRDVNLTDTNVTEVDFGKVASAHKIAYVAIRYTDFTGVVKDVNLSEKFAIRPEKFSFNLPSVGEIGANYRLKIDAIDILGNISRNYNEDFNTSFIIEYKERKPACDKGVINLLSAKFNDGNLTQVINYSEVGELDFNISEIPNYEFAVIDANDTSDSQRYILEANTTVKFTANRFILDNWELIDGAGQFTYYAAKEDTSSMGARLRGLVQAVDASGTPTKNYSSNCYAEDTNVTVSFDMGGNIQDRLVVDNLLTGVQDIKTFGSSSGEFNISIEKSTFIDGKSNADISINFDRNRSTAKDPMSFSITDINATDNDGVSGSATIDPTKSSSDFYYGRLHVPSYRGVNSEHNITVYQEIYCSNCNGSSFTQYVNGRESEDGVDWRVVPVNEYNATDLVFSNPKAIGTDFKSESDPNTIRGVDFTIDTNEVDKIEFFIPKFPFRDRVEYEPVPWLLYDRFGNRNVHFFNMMISSSSGNWEGKGREGNTMGLDASEEVKPKMDW